MTRDLKDIMAFRLIPRDEGFYPLFVEAAEIAREAAERLAAMLTSLPATDDQVVEFMKAEKSGDEVVREVGRRLEKSLITPFDREDISLLVSSLDDVTDDIFAAADLVLLHNVRTELAGVNDLTRLLVEITTANVELAGRLSSMRGIPELVDKIDGLESQADRQFRRVMAELFSGRHDALDILRWKNIVEAIERAIDAVEEASDIVMSVAVKNA